MRQHTSQSSALVDHTHARAQPGSVDSGAIQASAFGTVGQITTIDPDDTAAAGATGKIADAGHQHAFTSGVPSSLTRTATNAEGSSSSHARADHAHSTAALGWGVVAYMTPLTSNSSTFTTNTTTDMTISNVVVDATRLYVVHVHTEWTVTAASYWELRFRVGGVNTERLDVIQTTASLHGVTDSHALWFPSSGTVNLDIRVNEPVAGGDLTLEGAAGESRQFWIEDIGPR